MKEKCLTLAEAMRGFYGEVVDQLMKRKVLCPFHEEKTPSMMIDFRSMRYHCFGCGESGTMERDAE